MCFLESSIPIFLSLIHIFIRLDYGMDFVSDDENNNRYTRSAAYLEKWIEDQQLIFEDKPAFYIYEQVFSLDTDKTSHSDRPSHSLKGIIGLVQIEDFCKKIVLPHEETISKAKETRLNLMRTTQSNFSQVYSCLLYTSSCV